MQQNCSPLISSTDSPTSSSEIVAFLLLTMVPQNGRAIRLRTSRNKLNQYFGCTANDPLPPVGRHSIPLPPPAIAGEHPSTTSSSTITLIPNDNQKSNNCKTFSAHTCYIRKCQVVGINFIVFSSFFIFCLFGNTRWQEPYLKTCVVLRFPRSPHRILRLHPAIQELEHSQYKSFKV